MLYKNRVIKHRCLAFYRGPGRFRKLWEACRKHFHLSWYLSDPVVTSYGQKRYGESLLWSTVRTKRTSLIFVIITWFLTLWTDQKNNVIGIVVPTISSLDAGIEQFRSQIRILSPIAPHIHFPRSTGLRLGQRIRTLSLQLFLCIHEVNKIFYLQKISKTFQRPSKMPLNSVPKHVSKTNQESCQSLPPKVPKHIVNLRAPCLLSEVVLGFS